MAKQRCGCCKRSRKVGEDAFTKKSYRLWCADCYKAEFTDKLPRCFNGCGELATDPFTKGGTTVYLCRPCHLSWTQAHLTNGIVKREFVMGTARYVGERTEA